MSPALVRAVVPALALVLGCSASYLVDLTDPDACAPADLDADPDHCGACGVVCPEGQACIAGTCESDCPIGVVCARRCADLDVDDLHCGACDEACRPGESCVDAQCRETCEGACDEVRQLCVDATCDCRPGFVACGPECVDTATDPRHCGACDVECGGGACSDGSCRTTCEAPRVVCDGACVDLGRDLLHCGECGRACRSDEVCVNADCRAYHSAPCEVCPCDACGSEICCDDATLGSICVNDDTCG